MLPKIGEEGGGGEGVEVGAIIELAKVVVGGRVREEGEELGGCLFGGGDGFLVSLLCDVFLSWGLDCGGGRGREGEEEEGKEKEILHCVLLPPMESRPKRQEKRNCAITRGTANKPKNNNQVGIEPGVLVSIRINS